MTKKKETASDEFKEILSAKVGGEPEDWKRLSKKRSYGGDTEREFENKKTGAKVSIYERTDGLLFAELPDGSQLTARLPFNAAAQPSALDRVLNMIVETAPEIPDDLYAKAQKEGLAKHFSFNICRYDNGMAEEGEPPQYETFAVIFPTVRDETHRTAAYIRPLVPELYSVDECVVDEWRFKEGADTPGRLVKYLQASGMKWDEEGQKREPELYAEIKKELGESAPKAKAPAPKK